MALFIAVFLLIVYCEKVVLEKQRHTNYSINETLTDIRREIKEIDLWEVNLLFDLANIDSISKRDIRIVNRNFIYSS